MESESARPLEIRLHQSDAFEAGQGSHLRIYFAHDIFRRFAWEQNHEKSFDLFGTFDSRADRNPVEFEQLSRQKPRPARLQQQFARMIEIPGEMPALLFGDPLGENFEDRILSVSLKTFVPAQGRHLLDRSEGEIDGGELVGEDA